MTDPQPLMLSKPHNCVGILPDLASLAGQADPDQQRTCPTCGSTWRTVRHMTRKASPYAVWVQSGVSADLAAVKARVVSVRQAQATMVAVAVGATVTLTATWDTPWPDASYNTDVQLPAALIGKATVTVKSQTATAVTLTVLASQLLVAGSVFNLIGVRWA